MQPEEWEVYTKHMEKQLGDAWRGEALERLLILTAAMAIAMLGLRTLTKGKSKKSGSPCITGRGRKSHGPRRRRSRPTLPGFVLACMRRSALPCRLAQTGDITRACGLRLS